MRRCQLVTLVSMVGLLGPNASAQSISVDSLRAEIPSVIEAFQVPTPDDSVWVVGVLRSAPMDLALGRFNEENPFFLTYLLENATSFRFHEFLAKVPPETDPRPELYRRLGEDEHFVNAVHAALNRFLTRQDSIPTGDWETLRADEVISFASRFVRLDASPDGNPQLSLCAKSSDIRERPFEGTVVLEAWIYSMIRPGIQTGQLQESWSMATKTAVDSRPISSGDVMKVQRSIWASLEGHAEFRNHIMAEVERRQAYLPFLVER